MHYISDKYILNKYIKFRTIVIASYDTSFIIGKKHNTYNTKYNHWHINFAYSITNTGVTGVDSHMNFR